MELKEVFFLIIFSSLFAFLISFPLIHFLYKFKITRRMDVDFSSIVEKRNLKIGVPIMGGLIIIITVLFFNFFFNPGIFNKGLLLILFMFVFSAILGGLDDVLNIYGVKRGKPRSIRRTLILMKVHKNFLKRISLFLTLPWSIYKAFFYMLGSNPGKGIQSHEKILVQSFVGLSLGIGLYFFTPGFVNEILKIPLSGVTINIGFLFIPFAWLTVVLMANAVNFADGMDSLAAFQLFFSFAGFLLIALLKSDYKVVFLISTVLGSLIAYLYFNIPPARFQMGDVGSLSMGTLLAGVSFLLQEPLLLLIIGFPFVITFLSVLIQGIGRRLLGRRIFRMAPIHYHFQMANDWSEEKVVMRFALLSLFSSLVGVAVFLL